ncbi:MAG: diguanylate cyclase, partial [Magnetococcales bacterium]|nr:diguanylate cyclase [Magnetococcales bacterium]
MDESNNTRERTEKPTSEKSTQDAWLLNTLLENSSEGVFVVDRRGLIVRVNQAMCRIMQARQGDLLGRHARRFNFQSPNGDDLFETVYDALWQNGFWQGEVTGARQFGKPFRGLLRVNGILPPGGKLRLWVGQITDVVQGESHDNTDCDHSSLDPLTGLPSRTLFEDRLQQAMSQAERHDHSVGVMYLGLSGDRIKMVRNSLGQEAADKVMVTIAERLSETLRVSDSIARIDSVTFALLLSDINKGAGAIRNAGVVARKVYDSLDIPIVIGDQDIEMYAAMGITLHPQDGEDVPELLRNAETALSHARQKGWNNYQFFSTEMTETARKRFELESDLRRAIDRDELRLFYQPQVDLETGTIIGAEALIRWMHSTKGMISPGDFIPV